MKQLFWKVLEIVFGVIVVAACASCMFFCNKKVLATLAIGCAMLSGAGLAAAIGNFLIIYSVFGIVFLTAEILKPFGFGIAAFFMATIFFRAYGQKKFIEGYDFRKNA